MSSEKEIILNNRYRVLKPLGRGSMGNVYLVEHIKDKKNFVAKEMIFASEQFPHSESARDVFQREAEFMSGFNHRGLPKFYETFSRDSKDYIIMDYIEGKTLEDIIYETDKPIEEKKALKWTIELAEILYYLHNSFHKPVVYRDLKPANIIITPQEEVRLVDFGIARYYNPDKLTDTISYGSPGYAAPEQYKGRGQTTPQTDIYGLGVILHEMLTLYDPTDKLFLFPYAGTLNPAISKELADIVKKAIELDPAGRYRTMAEFKEGLEKYLGIYKSSADMAEKKTAFPGCFFIFACSFFSIIYRLVLLILFSIKKR